MDLKLEVLVIPVSEVDRAESVLRVNAEEEVTSES